LTHLIIKNMKNKTLEYILTPNLIYLSLGCFDEEIKENVLPPSLTYFILDSAFNKDLGENVLPLGLIHLTLGHYYNNVIIPPSLIELGLASMCPLIYNIPHFVKTLFINFNGKFDDTKITNFPSTLEKIKINNIKKIKLIEKIPHGCVIEEQKEVYFF
jgi:hypothetical protein